MFGGVKRQIAQDNLSSRLIEYVAIKCLKRVRWEDHVLKDLAQYQNWVWSLTNCLTDQLTSLTYEWHSSR